jgi:DNA-binding CsgD family transcriptional regulator
MLPKPVKQSITPTVIEAISITRPSGRSKLSLLVRTLPRDKWSESGHRPCLAIFLRDPERSTQGSSDVIRRLFDLTPAEATLALLLANGLGLEEAGEQLDIRRNTVRAHLRAIFSKMGVTRQTELVRMVLNSVVQLG